MRGSRYEMTTVGIDNALANVGSDLTCSSNNMGIVIPPNVATPPAGTPACRNRYTYMLARASFRTGERARLVGLRQFLSIGASVENDGEENPCFYPLELPVTTPNWRFVDGMVSWHVRRIPEVAPQSPLGLGSASVSFGGADSQTPALLGTAIGGVVIDVVGTYTPIPEIPGVGLIPDLNTFYGIRFPWNTSQAYFSLDYEIEGPCDIAFFATVKQSDPEERCTLVLPEGIAAGISNFLPPEEAFLQVFPEAVYKRIAGSLIFEIAKDYPC